jgi:hypothetical protein
MAAFDAGLVSLYTAQYSTNLELLLQQKGSKLRSKIDTGSHVGKMASPIQQIAPITAKQPAGRFAPKDNTQASYVRRWVFPQTLDVNQLVDTFDELQTTINPKAGLTQGAANAIGRAWDDAILVATTAITNYTTDAAPGYIIQNSFGAGSVSVGLTVAKLIELRRVYRKYHNDLDSDPVTLIIGSQQEADLLSQQQVVSADYTDGRVLVDGRIKRLLGFEVEVIERLPIVASSVRGCISFVKSGMYLGMWQEMQNNITQRVDLTSEPWQLYTKTMFGATRTQLGKVFQVNCADSTGVDITP